MSLTRRAAVWNDIETALSIQQTNRGDCIDGVRPALGFWRHLFHSPFFLSAVLESNPPLDGHRLIGLGSAVIVTSEFANSEIAAPRPNIVSRIFASLQSGCSVIATEPEVAAANSEDGVSVVILYNAWRDELLGPQDRRDLEVLFPSSLQECLAGFRVRYILAETSNEITTDFLRRSVVWRTIAEFPDLGRVIHLMSVGSITAVNGSLGNLIFQFREPRLRLRNSDQELLLAALRGATDREIAAGLGITISAVKARWRSTYAHISEEMPELARDAGNDIPDHEGRGGQKRHRVLAYLRDHQEELRPYVWRVGSRS